MPAATSLLELAVQLTEPSLTSPAYLSHMYHKATLVET